MAPFTNKKRKGMLEKAVIMSGMFLIPQFPQNTGQLVFDLGEKGMKQESDTVLTTVI